MRRVLAVGGSDSGGGAGIQADLKAMHAIGVHASTVLTAVTAQDTVAVRSVHPLPVGLVQAQLHAVLSDIGADVVKTGMLATAETVHAVADAVGSLPLVVDPVGVSSTGQSLLDAPALGELRAQLLPKALVVTPNIAEVEALTGFVIRSAADLAEGARAVHALGPTWVVVTGGHLVGAPDDLLYDGSLATTMPGQRVDTSHTHGSGCTFAAALAAHLALGADVPAAALLAKRFTTEAISRGYPLGSGAGPVRA